MNDLNSLNAISPIDGRYRSQVCELADYFSEKALNRHRLIVEAEWFVFLSERDEIEALAKLPPETQAAVREIAENFSIGDAQEMKKTEKILRHDVKAVEYFLKNRLERIGLGDSIEMVHFLCTSEDVNNLAYALMIKGAHEQVLLPEAVRLLETLFQMAKEHARLPMISRTHGQPASPTTLGKEIFVFCDRLVGALENVKRVSPLGKINGAVGNFNAHYAAYPEADWPELSRLFVEKLGLKANPVTTQIEPHDWVCELCSSWSHWNNTLLDLCRDFWGYVAMEDLVQSFGEGTVGSSTMPHKVNPIQFENAEANLGVANALLGHLAAKLPVSRWQRDLSDSSALRNLGTAFAHTLLSLKNCAKGLALVAPNREKLKRELDESWELIGEAIQSVMRKHGLDKPYERMKELTQGKRPDREILLNFVESLDLPSEEKKRLTNLGPSDYLGNAGSLIEMDAFNQTFTRLSGLRLRKE